MAKKQNGVPPQGGPPPKSPAEPAMFEIETDKIRAAELPAEERRAFWQSRIHDAVVAGIGPGGYGDLAYNEREKYPE